MKESVLVSGLSKLSRSSKDKLYSWNSGAIEWRTLGDLVNEREEIGTITGYLQALVDLKKLDLQEAVELHSYFTKKEEQACVKE